MATTDQSMTASPAPSLPRLERHGSASQLLVDGRPFLVRGGEIGNSSGEPEYLAQHWDTFEALRMNTVVAPVYWDQVEPVEGSFTFSTVDGLIGAARGRGMRLVLLWFGSWKNSMSCYAPAWVKTDTERFPRSRDSRGRALEILTPFSGENRDADARAFAALLRHLAEVDVDHTVILVQVENEIGMIPEARDRCAAAERAYGEPVPPELITYLQANQATLTPELRARWQDAGGRVAGSWPEVFGPGVWTDELFMAWHFARYVQHVAAAGKAELDLPMYTNAALPRTATLPGQYPGAGPLPHLIDIWQAAAPSLSFISPDIYFPDFVQWADRYTRPDNPLFVPEALRSVEAAENAFYAYGACSAIGFSPFGIETIEELPATMLAGAYDIVAQLSPLIVEHTGQTTMAGLVKPTEDQRFPHQITLGDLVLNVTYERIAAPALADGVINESGDRPRDETRLPAGGIVIRTSADELVFGGIGLIVTFSPSPASEDSIGILSCEEGHFVDGAWQHIRWLNGDQTHQGRHLRLEPGRFTVQRIRLYRYR